jgi:aromatic ring hydroxylase-like protein
VSVSAESRLEAERDLHEAIAAHPEVLPSEDLGLGPLIALGTELDFGPAPLDRLAADPQGRIAIIEFKRSSENPDVPRVSLRSSTTARVSGARRFESAYAVSAAGTTLVRPDGFVAFRSHDLTVQPADTLEIALRSVLGMA